MFAKFVAFMVLCAMTERFFPKKIFFGHFGKILGQFWRKKNRIFGTNLPKTAEKYNFSQNRSVIAQSTIKSTYLPKMGI